MTGLSRGNVVLIIFLIIMVFNSIQSGRFDSPSQWLMDTLLRLPAIVIAITFHEFMHAFSAWKLGDQTPMAQKRVTLNPASHIDPFGIVALVFVGFGWGRPVEVNPFAFTKNRRLSNIIVDVSGVAMNFVIAFFCTALLFVVTDQIVFTIILNIVYINFILMVFNLLPIPPLDGFGIITELFDLRRFSWYRPLYNNGFIILMVFIITGLLGRLLWPSLSFFFGFSQDVWRQLMM